MTNTLTLLLMAFAVAGCVNSTAQPAHPALIVNPTAASRTELLQTVRGALNNTTLILADDALTHEPVLLIERTPRRDISGQLLNGRVIEKQERFALSVRNGHCVLTQDSSHRHWVLNHSQCVAQ